MSANTQPIFSATQNLGTTKLATTSAVAASDGSSTGSSPSLMYCIMASGANGSFLQRVRFNSVASAANTNSVATVLRIYLSTVATTVGSAAGATTSANTMLIAEISAPVVSSANSGSPAMYFDVPINAGIPTNKYILVAQHTAQTTNQQWQATAIGGDY